MNSTPIAEQAFLSIARQPDLMDRPALARVIHELTGIDSFHLNQRLAKGVMPLVIQRILASEAAPMVANLRKRGIAAFAPTTTQLRTFAPVTTIKRITPALGSPEPMFLAEPWRAEPFGFPGKHIALLVRARLRRVTKSETRMEATGVSYEPITGTVSAQYEAVRDTRVSVGDILDIYLHDRRCLRCDADKFSFETLGADRGYSDNVNMDKLSVMLAESAPRAIVDLGFAEFSCPPAIVSVYRSTAAGGSVRNDLPLFDFYSPWVLQAYRVTAGGERS